MTDRELLERAAKVAGMKLPTDRPSEFDLWNPLEDDGDALRLAVKLDLEIGFSIDGCVYAFKRRSTHTAEEPRGSDAYAATRRAIVRAAASLAVIETT